MKKKPYIIFAEIVDSLRVTGTITNVTTTATGNYLVTAANLFVKNDFIKITNDNGDTFEDIQIMDADSISFVIETNISYNAAYAYTYKANAPYDMHEKQPKANEILTQKVDKTLKWQKYPLVLLMHPYTENYSNAEYVEIDSLKCAIINNTESEKNSDERYADNFVPILDPIYEGVIDGIIEHEDVPIYLKEHLDYSKIDELFIDGNPLPDKLDGILLDFNNFKIKRKC